VEGVTILQERYSQLVTLKRLGQGAESLVRSYNLGHYPQCQRCAGCILVY